MSDRAHAQGVKTVVWFEPERVWPGSWLWERHPEWLLRCPAENRQTPELGRFANRLLDLGNPQARAWLVDHVERMITRDRIDVYRQDFNINPLAVGRYVERNALRAKLVDRAADWQWCSLWRRCQDDPGLRALLSAWPMEIPVRWSAFVERAQTAAELEAIRRSVVRGRPYGDDSWAQRTAKRFGLESTFRPQGRPRKKANPCP